MKDSIKDYSIRGNIFVGTVIRSKVPGMVIVSREITKYVPKYERYMKLNSKVKAHVPEDVTVKEGNIVKIGETRKLSKTKNFVVIEVLSSNKA
jgi:small subunit ribosomal protein S17